jgi:polysaccharide biosynthesis/export protein
LGCATAPIMTAQNEMPVLPPPEPANELLAAGDQIEVIYTRTNAHQPGPYLLQVGDVISIEVTDQPDITTKDVRVLPDGRVSMRIVGNISVVGRSAEQVARTIADALMRKNVPAPDVVVSVQSANQPLEQFMRSAAPDTQGSRLQVRLASDEQLSLPLISPIRAVGRPLATVREEITSAYSKLFASQLNVTVNLREQSESVVYVEGEVAKPGIQPLKARMNAAMMVAAAGGPSAVGDQTEVLVVRFRPDGSSYHWKVDLTTVESAAQSPGFDVALRNRDIIYVPRTGIGDVNDWVDLYLRRNVPLPLGFGVTP